MYYGNIGPCYSEISKSSLFEFVDVSYLSDPHKARSQMRYVFIYGCTTISWISIKQIMETCGLPSIRGNATKLYNIVCIAQIKEELI